MSHTPQGADRLLIKPAAGARPAPPCTRGRIIRKARTHAASHPKSHTRHGGTRLATASDRPTPRVSQSPEDDSDVLEDPQQAAQVLRSACRVADEDVVATRR